MAQIRQLRDDENNAIYPITKINAVYMTKGAETLENALGDVIGQDQQIKFESNGNITKSLASGNVITTRFMNDGSIEETTKDKDDVVLQVKRTVFNTDGTIDITVEDK